MNLNPLIFTLLNLSFSSLTLYSQSLLTNPAISVTPLRNIRRAYQTLFHLDLSSSKNFSTIDNQVIYNSVGHPQMLVHLQNSFKINYY